MSTLMEYIEDPNTMPWQQRWAARHTTPMCICGHELCDHNTKINECITRHWHLGPFCQCERYTSLPDAITWLLGGTAS